MTWQNAGSLAAVNGSKNFVGTSTLLLGAFVDDALFYTSGTTIWLSDIASIADNTHCATQDNWPFSSGTVANGNWGVIPCSPLRQTTATLNNQIATLIGQYSSILSLSTSDNYATFNKALAANNNGVYFTTAGAAVARIGTFGDNQLRLSVSPSGGGYTDALVIDRTTALATLAGDPTAALGAATKQYVDGAIANKLVRAASTTNITISSPGTSIGGVTAANGEAYLLAGQSTASQNGIYVFNGASSAMTRATNADSATELQPGILVSASEGAFANQVFILTTAAPLVIGTTALTFARLGSLLTATVTAAFGTGGVGLVAPAYTQTDSTTAAGTVATAYGSLFGAVTFATASNAVTITSAMGVYFKDPVPGANVTLTKKYALGADSLFVSGAATVGSVNKMAVTAPATSSTLAIADGATFTVNQTLTLAGTAGTTMTFPTGSATLARTDAGQTFTGAQLFTAVAGHVFGGGAAQGSTVNMWADTNSHAALDLDSSDTGSASQVLVYIRRGSGPTVVGSISTTNTATAFNTSSDKRLKEDPRAVTSSGSIIDALEVWDFRWKNSGSRSIGLFAQDAYEVYPDPVFKPADEEQGWSIDYSKYVPLLLQEAKQMRIRVAQLEGQSSGP